MRRIVRRTEFLPLILLCCAVFFCPASAQDSEAELRFIECSKHLNRGDTEAARNAFLIMSEDYKGSAWGAEALIEAAFWSEPPEDRQLYQRVVNEYSGTKAEIVARKFIINIDFIDDPHGEVENIDQLVMELGGPSLADILSGNFALDHDQINPDYLKHLYGTYDYMQLVLRRRTKEYQKAYAVAAFIRETFSPLGITLGTEVGAIEASLNNGQFIQASGQRANPMVNVETPQENETSSLTPQIILKITVGDASYLQTDLSALEIKLDGEDVKPFTKISTQHAIQSGEPFETVTLHVEPPSPLSQGAHRLEVTAFIEDYKEEGPGLTSISRNFFVSSATQDVTLPTTRDTTLLIRNPHQNEGANPRLHLKKVTGKPAQVLVGFDTANIDARGLTKASLVLNIDSTQNVTGWGNGRPIRAQPLLTAWTEGNGKTLDLPNNQKFSGSGSGATWFSPIDSNISNNFADSTVNWNGAATYAAPSTAPKVTIKNHQSGEVSFDVTQDLVSGAEHGWLISRDQDVGSQVTFLSKEGGNSALAPKLILEYAASAANLEGANTGLLAYLDLIKAPNLTRLPSGSELQTAREILQGNPVASMFTEQVLSELTRGNPAFSLASRLAYHSWLEQEPRLVLVREFRLS